MSDLKNIIKINMNINTISNIYNKYLLITYYKNNNINFIINNELWDNNLNLLYHDNSYYIYNLFSGYSLGVGEYFLIFINLFSIIAALSVIITINPVISVFFLIILYISVAIFIYLIGIIFIGLTYIIVYVGAIAILFLFIIMMLDIELSEISTKLKININNNNLIFFLSIIFLFPFLSIIFNQNNYYSNMYTHIINIFDFNFINNSSNFINKIYLDDYLIYFLDTWEPIQIASTQVTGLGNILYNNQAIYIFIISIILLLSIIGAIILTLDYKDNIYNENKYVFNNYNITNYYNNKLRLNKYI